MCGPALVYAQIISYRNFQSVTVDFHEHQGGRTDPDRVIVGYNYSLGNKKEELIVVVGLVLNFFQIF